MEVEVLDTGPFKVLYDLPKETNLIICIGGRGGRKTYEVSKYIAFSATIKKKRCVVLRDEKALIKESILNEIWSRYDSANETGILDKFYSKNETELKDKATGKTLIYTKGFRASDNQKAANLKGPSDIDIAIIEEGEDIRDPNKFNTFVDGLRKEGCIVIIMLNTPSIQHFLIERYFNTEQVADGYYKVIPKEIPGFICIQTSYKDNPFLPAHIISNYEGYGTKGHHLYDLHYYYTAILGHASVGRRGQIFTKVRAISRAEYNALPYKTIYGQDFGTASPAALAGIKLYQNNCYMDCLNYLPMDVLSIAKKYVTLKLNHHTDKIVCDYAEPDSILQLQSGFKNQPSQDYLVYQGLAQGWYAVPCPAKDIEARISLMKTLNLYLVDDCKEAWKEVHNYVYATDKYGNPTDSPVDDFNHFLDAAGYAIVAERGQKGVVFS